jgi:monoamine oxidase
MLLKTLYNALDKEDVLFNQTVKKIQEQNNSIVIEATENHEADLVVLAIPPKLWAQHISFIPDLSFSLKNIATKTHTWMEDSMKVAFVYETPFWREKKQSGTFFSNTGPITELYDHTNLEGNKYALCGFVNPNMKDLAIEERKTVLTTQLRENFGEEATQFTEYQECMWSEEKNTFTPSLPPLHTHQNNGNPIFTKNPYKNRLLFSSTEVSPHHGGYMEGAVFIAEEIANKILQQLS